MIWLGLALLGCAPAPVSVPVSAPVSPTSVQLRVVARSNGQLKLHDLGGTVLVVDAARSTLGWTSGSRLMWGASMLDGLPPVARSAVFAGDAKIVGVWPRSVVMIGLEDNDGPGYAHAYALYRWQPDDGRWQLLRSLGPAKTIYHPLGRMGAERWLLQSYPIAVFQIPSFFVWKTATSMPSI